MYKYKMQELYHHTLEELEKIGVKVEDIAKVVMELQKPYIDGLTLEECVENIHKILQKREVVHAVLTGLAIDEMANKKLLPEPIQSIISNDEGLYGIDEILPLGIINLYGSIGLTNFGYLDKQKEGIIKELDERKRSANPTVTTFADDIVAAIAAAAASRIAHSNRLSAEQD